LGLGRQVAFPNILEVSAMKTFEALPRSYPLNGGVANSVEAKQVLEPPGHQRLAFVPGTPRTSFELVEPGHKGICGNVPAIIVGCKEGANIVEQLEAEGAVFLIMNIKGPHQGHTRFSGPLAAEGVGDGEQGHGKLALTEGKTRMHHGDVTAMVDQGVEDVVVFDPMADLFHQRPGPFDDGDLPHGHSRFAARAALQHDGNGALGQGSGQGAGTGKGFRAVDVLVFPGMADAANGVLAVAGATGAEKADDGLGLSGTKGGLPVIEQQGRAALGDAFHEAGGGQAAARHPGIAGEIAEHLQADGLAGLLFRGVDVEVGSAGKSLKAVGMDDPESQDGALMLGADQEFPQ